MEEGKSLTKEDRYKQIRTFYARDRGLTTMLEIVEMLDLPPGDALRTFLLDTLAAQARALAQHQDPSGLWHTLIVDPTSYLAGL